MKTGSFLDDRTTKDVVYSYHKRGTDTPYLPDALKEKETCNHYTKENGNLFFKIPVSWSGFTLLREGIDLKVQLGEKCFVDHVVIVQGGDSEPAGVEVMTITDGKYRKTGSCMPETGKLLAREEIIIPVGVYCDNVILRFNGDCRPVHIRKLDILGAWELENAIWPAPCGGVYTQETILLKNIRTIQASGKDERFAAEYLCEKMQEKCGYAPKLTDETGDIVIRLNARNAGDKGEKDFFKLDIAGKGCRLEAAGRRGLLYAADALLQCMEGGRIKGCHVEEEAFMELRGVHIALPDKAEIPFLKKLIKYVLVPMRYNMVILQISGAMRYERFPEISERWREACVKYEQGEWPMPPHYGFVSRDIWEKEEVRQLCRFMTEYGLEVIPEIQSFSHSQYITMAYPGLAEKGETEGKEDARKGETALSDEFYHHTLCTLHPDYYRVIFGISDEVLEAVQPVRYVHMGHDEIYNMGICPVCSKLRREELFAREVNTLNEYIKSRKLTMIIWADMLQPQKYASPAAINKISGDIIMADFVWYFHMEEDTEDTLLSHGFQVIMGNMYSSHYPRFEERSHKKGILGAEVSTWVPCSERSYAYEGKLFDLVFSAAGMWDKGYRSDMRLTYNEILKPLLRDMRFRIGNLTVNGAERHIAVDGTPENIPFDIRGIVPYSRAAAVSVASVSAEITVNAYAELLTFVHATDKDCRRIMWEPALKIGEYVICYEDGSAYTENILYALNIYKYLAPFGDRITSPEFRHEGYIATYLMIPECGKTCAGEDYTLGKYSIRNPYPEKKIRLIRLNHCKNTGAEILLFDILLYAGQQGRRAGPDR